MSIDELTELRRGSNEVGCMTAVYKGRLFEETRRYLGGGHHTLFLPTEPLITAIGNEIVERIAQPTWDESERRQTRVNTAQMLRDSEDSFRFGVVLVILDEDERIEFIGREIEPP